MDRYGLVIQIAPLFLFMIVLGQSNAFDSRKLVTSPDPNGSSNANQVLPSSFPPHDDKKPNLSPDEATKPKDSPYTTPSNVESKGLNDANTKKTFENSNDKGKSQDGKEKVEKNSQSETFASKNCKGNPICSDQDKTMIACVQDFENGSNKLTIIVQNEGDADKKVKITFGKSTNNYLPAVKIPAHGIEKVNITFVGEKGTKVILNAGNGDCELLISQPKTTKVNIPSKSKDTENNSNSKDVDDLVNTPIKPKDVNDPAKSNDENDPSKSKEVNDPSKSKEVNDPSKSKDENDPKKSKEVNDTSKSKDDNDPSKSKEVNDPSKSKDENAPHLPNPTTTTVDTPISQNNFLDQLTFYSKQLTPIYGVYFAFLVSVIIGGSWALCTFRKRRRTDNGVPYQELEMGLPESSGNPVNMETTQGWDQDWDDDDDDWDDDVAIRSPGGRIQTKTISSNGLTSRATKKDGWDADWDD